MLITNTFLFYSEGLTIYDYIFQLNVSVFCFKTGILHQMQKESPHKTFIPAPPENMCACNDCPYMKLNTLEKLYLCMEYEEPQIIMDENLMRLAKKPIERMLEISQRYGL